MSNPSHLEVGHGKPEKTYSIVVNGQEKIVTNDVLIYEDVINLAFQGEVSNPDLTFKIVYRKAEKSHHEGSMVQGDTVKIIDGTIFDATRTTRS